MTGLALNRTHSASVALVSACVLSVLLCASSVARESPTSVVPNTPGYSTVMLEQCIPSSVQSERSATFTAQMVATSQTTRMGMRIELQQRLRGESTFHTLVAPGFGVWRNSEAGVRIYKYVKQVANLDAPAAYRAVVRFRWLGEKGRMLKRTELRTARCLQPTLSGQVTQTPSQTPAP